MGNKRKSRKADCKVQSVEKTTKSLSASYTLDKTTAHCEDDSLDFAPPVKIRSSTRVNASRTTNKQHKDLGRSIVSTEAGCSRYFSGNANEPQNDCGDAFMEDYEDIRSDTESTGDQKARKCDSNSKETLRQSGSDSDSDWEEVAEMPYLQTNQAKGDAKKSLEITLEAPDIMKKKQKGKFDIQDWMRLEANKIKRETQILVHQVHLLCLLAEDFRFNNSCNEQILQATALSMLSGSDLLLSPPNSWGMANLTSLLDWFLKEFIVDEDLEVNDVDRVERLSYQIQMKKTSSYMELNLILIMVCRALGLDVRLVHALQPTTHKATDLEIKTPKQVKRQESISQPSSPNKSAPPKKSCISAKLSSLKEASKKRTGSKHSRSADGIKSIQAKVQTAPRRATKNSKSRRSVSLVSYAENSKSDEEHLDQIDGQNDNPTKHQDHVTYVSSDEDFEPALKQFRSPVSTTSRNISSHSVPTPREGIEYWCEVFLREEQKWACVDCVGHAVNQPGDLQARIKQPPLYIVAYNNAGRAKDVTARYDSNYYTKTCKSRVNQDWWCHTLEPYGPRTEIELLQDAEENQQMKIEFLMKPLPSSVQEFKNHELYALKRHLLKFEAIYPNSSIPLGYIKGEPIYARECVHELHSRETWLKEARVVKMGEEPYKFVKSRKRRATSDPREGKEEILTPIFGRWQTEEYFPPPAVDGIVPKNEYGNVELFKPSMLPPGTVHLKFSGIHNIAKKLGIDYAMAMVGWEQHGNFSHPLLDGIIVCVESRELLVSAWKEDRLIKLQKEAEKKQARVMANWKKLIRGLRVRERMKIKFQLEEPEASQSQPGPDCLQGTDAAAQERAQSWPRNKQIQSGSGTAAGPKIFPFEMEQM